MYPKIKSSEQQRVQLNEEILKKIIKRISSGRISEVADDIGLPYDLAYNLVNGRINSLSAENYKLIFGEAPPKQTVKRVDSSYFREMVRLWLFLNEDIKEADLYWEFYGNKNVKKVDYRIFSEATKTVDNKIENAMEQKYIDQGFNRIDIKKLIRELNLIEKQERVHYKDIKPILNFLSETLEINPTRILNQWFVRYEGGELKTVSKKIYDDALELKKRAEKAIESGSRFKIEKIREEIYGEKKGYKLFSEVEEELKFLRKFGGKNPRQYLGRSISHYKKSRLKRIASWRVLKIKDACYKLIDDHPEMALKSLPTFHRKTKLKKMLTVLKSYIISKATKEEYDIESSILMSAYYQEQNNTEEYGLISLNKAGYFLGMSKTAFDLLVSENLDVFRKVGTYNKQWYVPYVYLKKIKEKNGFDILKAKYEMLAKKYTEFCKRQVPYICEA